MRYTRHHNQDYKYIPNTIGIYQIILIVLFTIDLLFNITIPYCSKIIRYTRHQNQHRNYIPNTIGI